MSALSEHYKLVIVGEGPLKDEFQKMTKELNLDLKVKHLGQVPNNELVSYTRGADIGLCLIEPVNLSKKLSLPNKIFEYIHAGIPVLGSELPEIKQIINMYNCGEIAALEINKIVDQIVKMSRSDYKLGLKLAQEALTWENEKQELLAVLSD
jgi:glycosyltransferase involved in cell wall biosynthesis